jgi:hypothetical protein
LFLEFLMSTPVDDNARLEELGRTAELIRARFRPERISVLFVGESAPAGGTFFYHGNSRMLREFRDALLPKIGDAPDFLTAFVDRGYFLDDLILTPVNWFTQAERRDLHRSNVRSLATRLSAYQPLVIVSVLKAIRTSVEEARTTARLDVPHYTVSFPGMGQQARFRSEMAALLDRLP